jgi:hypothetical protein
MIFRKWREFFRLLRRPDPLLDLWKASIKTGVPYERLTAPLRDEKGSLQRWIESRTKNV